MCRDDTHGMKRDGFGNPYLVIWENERISYDNIFPSRSVEYHNLGNIIRSERLAAAVEKLTYSCVVKSYFTYA